MKKKIISLFALTVFFVGSSFIAPSPVPVKSEQLQKLSWPDDEDEDGVPDWWDLCPGTPRNVEVDPNGCPIV